MIITIGAIIVVASIVLGAAVAWLASCRRTGGALELASFFGAAAAAGLGILMIAIGVMTG